ncbi:MAG: MFS transporter [Clostridia bacterium]
MSSDESQRSGDGLTPRGWRTLSQTPGSLKALLVGSAIADLGNGFFRLSLPWLVYNLTGSSAALGTLVALTYLPTLLMPWIGRLVDRTAIRLVMVLSLLLQFVTLGALVVLLRMHRLDIPLVDIGALLAGAGGLVAWTSTEVAVQRLTPPVARVAVNGLWWMLFNISWYVSPALAGLVIGRLGIDWALVFNAVAVLVMLVPVIMLPALRPVAAEGGPFGEPWRALRSAQDVFIATVVFGYWNFTWAAVYALEVFLFRHRLHLSAPMVGLVGLVAGVFPTVLTVLAPYIVARVQTVWLLSASLLISGCGMLVLAVAHNWWTATLALGLIDGVVAPVGIVVATLSQRSIPSRLYGQVVGWQTFIQGGGSPLASILAGAAAVVVGAGGAIGGAAAFTLAAGVVLPASPWRRILQRSAPLS